jgi:F0F1-type ATP synthase membrane subunit c/vacuolar-type H+-ATPase subunit K
MNQNEPSKLPYRPNPAYRRVTIQLAVLAVGLAIVGGVVAYLLAGIAGMWGALFGALVVGLFFASSALVMARSKSQEAASRNLLITWFVKLVALLGVLMVLDSITFVNRIAFGVTVMAGIVGSLALETRVVMQARDPNGPSKPPR